MSQMLPEGTLKGQVVIITGGYLKYTDQIPPRQK